MKKIILLGIGMLFFSCVFAQRTQTKDRVYEETGIIFFTDRAIVRKLDGMDVKYSLDDNSNNPDFFIPMPIKNQTKICLNDVMAYLRSKPVHTGYQLTFLNDCGYFNRRFYIDRDAESLQLDSVLNDQGKAIYMMPARIRYLTSNRGELDDLYNNGKFRLRFSLSEKAGINISSIVYNVLDEVVLRDRDECK